MIECTFKVNTIYNGQVYLKDQTYQLANKIAKALGFGDETLEEESETTVVVDDENKEVEVETEDQKKDESEQTGKTTDKNRDDKSEQDEDVAAAEDDKQEK